MNISLDDLKSIIEALLQHQEEIGRADLHMDTDYYWSMYAVEKYNPYEEPTKFTMGQVSMDIDNLMALATGKHEPTNLDFVWLGELLIAIGHTIQPKINE